MYKDITTKLNDCLNILISRAGVTSIEVYTAYDLKKAQEFSKENGLCCRINGKQRNNQRVILTLDKTKDENAKETYLRLLEEAKESYKIGDYQTALSKLELAVSFRKEIDHGVAYSIAKCYDKLGNKKRACDYLFLCSHIAKRPELKEKYADKAWNYKRKFTAEKQAKLGF